MLRGDRIKLLRTQQGISQVVLGKAIGQDNAYISRLETGIYKNLMADTLHDIACVLGCSADYLLGHSDDPKPRPPRGRAPEGDLAETWPFAPTRKQYLLKNHLDRIKRLFGVKPGLVDPQEYDSRFTPRRSERVPGYWLAQKGYAVYGEDRMEYVWELWTETEPPERHQGTPGPVAVELPGAEYLDRDFRFLTEEQAYALLRALTPQSTRREAVASR